MSAIHRPLLLVALALLLGACGSRSNRWNCKFTCTDGTERDVTVNSPVDREPCGEGVPEVKCPGGPILVCRCVVVDEPSGPLG